MTRWTRGNGDVTGDIGMGRVQGSSVRKPERREGREGREADLGDGKGPAH